MITYKSENNSKKLSADSYQGLGPNHAPVNGALIPLMHHAAFPDGAQSCEIQKLSHERPAALGDAKLALVLPRADFVQVKPRKLQYLRDGAELGEISYFADQTRCRDRANPFKRKDKAAIRDLFQVPQHLGLKAFDKTVVDHYGVKHQPDLEEHAAAAFSDTDRFVRGFKKRSGTVFPEFPPADFSEQCSQGGFSKSHNVLRLWIMPQKVLGARGLHILHHLQKLGKGDHQETLQLIKQPRAAFNRSFSCLSEP